MLFKTVTAALAAVSLSTVALAQTAAAPEFTADAFRSHVAFLADDLLQGRDTGSEGYDIAARYVATRFAGLGLEPAGPNGSWYQQVPFVRYKLADTPATLTIGDQLFPNGEQVLIGANAREPNQTIEAPVVFVGYGIDAPEQGFDDYAGLDVEGKIVAVISGTPKGTPSELAASLNRQKSEMAAENGAIGVVTIRSRADEERRPWKAMSDYGSHASMTWIGEDGLAYSASPTIRATAALGPDAAKALFAGAPHSLDSVLDEAAKEGGKPKGFALDHSIKLERQSVTEKISSPNVVAVLPGSDPALADEYVLLMGHLDHVGVDPTEEGEDKIFNGAMDNATGISTLLEVARAMVESGERPRRPILFAAVTAEEKGLLGSQYLAKHPVVDGKVVGVVNLDMPVLLYDFVDVIAFGAEHSTLGPIVERAGARMGVKLIDDPLPEEGLFTRSDHYRFVQEGIPSVFLMTGFGNGGDKQFTGFLKGNYHGVGDDISQPIDWQAGAKFARINYLIAREIADADQAPRWYADSPFGDAFAPEAPKATR